MNEQERNFTRSMMLKLQEQHKALRRAEEDAAMWEAAFYELLDYHFAEGGTSPNLRFDRIKVGAVPPRERYDTRNNVDHLTVVRKDCWL